MEKYRDQKELHCVFVDQKAYDKHSGLAEKYVRIVQDMYDDSITGCLTEGFEVRWDCTKDRL